MNFFTTSTKIKQNNYNVFPLVDRDMLVNTIVPIFHAQNLLHILKNEKANIKFMNFNQKYMGSVFLGSPCMKLHLTNLDIFCSKVFSMS